ncbi:SGNH/GDSL hydrolase family protein [Alkaliflexus imshenetskii]|uniref:SGNH/GDSL hydrolase family protein n=1 Tax=Alkaliflexus imshenetskii TaxID=286730 RepID=UPI00047BDB80|nr:SGNH/GDSL hydrolase family protein [Alkaliflexus imshenetskii]
MRYILSITLALIFWQCDIKTDDFATSAGEADFAVYVALGDSYSAGYMDGALGLEGQQTSLPAMLAEQFKLVGGGEFKQPLMPEGKSAGTTVIDQSGNINGYFELKVVGGALRPVPTVGDKTVFSQLIGSEAPFNNMSVPGAKSFHLLAPAFSNPVGGNPFFVRFAKQPGVSSVISDALKLEATFFSLWIGGNDVLTYALSGGTSDIITPLESFQMALSTLITELTMLGSKGVIANIPDIDALPYFNLVPYNALPLSQVQADQLNAAYAQYNLAANGAGRPAIVFVAGQNAMVIADPKMTDMPTQLRFRQIKANEKFLMNLPTDKIATEGWGSQVPVPANYTLDADDLQKIKAATTGYNEIIKTLATENGLAFVDINELMNQIKAGLVVDGHTYSNNFVTGGVLSLDGIHATPRGYAIIANEFIRAINNTYKASVPLVNVNDYSTVIFPL